MYHTWILGGTPEIGVFDWFGGGFGCPPAKITRSCRGRGKNRFYWPEISRGPPYNFRRPGPVFPLVPTGQSAFMPWDTLRRAKSPQFCVLLPPGNPIFIGRTPKKLKKPRFWRFRSPICTRIPAIALFFPRRSMYRDTWILGEIGVSAADPCTSAHKTHAQYMGSPGKPPFRRGFMYPGIHESPGKTPFPQQIHVWYMDFMCRDTWILGEIGVSAAGPCTAIHGSSGK